MNILEVSFRVCISCALDLFSRQARGEGRRLPRLVGQNSDIWII